MGKHYCFVQRISYRQETLGGLLFVPHRSLVLEFNHTAYQIIQMISNGKSKEEICISQGSECVDSISKFIQRLEHSEIIKEVDEDGQHIY